MSTTSRRWPPPAFRDQVLSSLWPLWIDLLVVIATFLVALALRLPYLGEVPRYTDEVNEVDIAYRIAQGTTFPLINFDGYIGAFFNYVVAGLFLVFGANPHLPRLLTAFTSAATVGITYVFGHRLADRWTGVIAALLVAGNAQNIVNSSHVGYSHSISPVLTTLALWLLWEGLGRPQLDGSLAHAGDAVADRARRRRAFLAGSLMYGIALQTHPTTIAFAPGIVVAYILRRTKPHPPGIRSTLGAVLLAALGCGNLIVYNTTTAGKGVAAALDQHAGLAARDALTLDRYRSFVVAGFGAFFATLDGAVGSDPLIPHRLEWGILGVSVGLFLLGFLILIRRGQTFVPICLLGWLMLLPSLTGNETQLNRYWMPALPLATVASATAITYGIRTLGPRLPRAFSLIGSILLVSILVTNSWPGLAALYQQRASVSPTNADLEALARSIKANRVGQEKVLVETTLFAKKQVDETSEIRTVQHLVELSGISRPPITDLRGILLEVNENNPTGTTMLVSPGPIARELRGVVNLEELPLASDRLRALPVTVSRLRAFPPLPETPNGASASVDAVFNAGIRLLGYRISDPPIRCGGVLLVTLYWMRVGPIATDYTVFNHLQLGDRTIGHQDGQPGDGRSPTSRWNMNQIVADDYGIPVDGPCDGVGTTANPSPVVLDVGLYDAQTMKRLPLSTSRGETGRDFFELPTNLSVVQIDRL